MKSMAIAVWGAVPNKRQVLMIALIVCVVLSVLGGSFTYVFFNVEIHNNETPWQLFHRHSNQHTVHNTDSIDNHTNILKIVKEASEIRAQLTDVKTVYWMHQITKDQHMDEKNNWKSDKDREEWKAREREIKGYMNELKADEKDKNSMFDDGLQFAQRDR